MDLFTRMRTGGWIVGRFFPSTFFPLDQPSLQFCARTLAAGNIVNSFERERAGVIVDEVSLDGQQNRLK